jgi:patatin-related protein
VFRFRYADGEDGFAAPDNVALAFAARATSCFPGAFEPVSRPLFYSYLREGAGAIDDSFFRIYALSRALVDETYFIDGGVLDNRPFGPAIDAIRGQAADVDVDRRLLYLDPDPPVATSRAPGRSPATLSTLLGAVSGLPRKQPILDSLVETDLLNARVREVRDVIETSFDHVAEQTEGSTAASLTEGIDPATLADHQQQLHTAAREQAGTAYATYVRAKIAGVLAGAAQGACRLCDYPVESNQAMLATAALEMWAREGGLLADALSPSEAQLAFLRGLDVEYSRRRARFVLGGVNWYYERLDEPGYPSRAELDAVKARLWREIDGLRAAVGEAMDALEAEVTACFPEQEITDFLWQSGLDAAGWAGRKRRAIDAFTAGLAERLRPVLDEHARSLYGDLLGLTADWHPDRRREVHVRFIGFAFWDVQLYTLETVAGAGERDTVEVVRMSPLDATLLNMEGDVPKLRGTACGHFGAFFKRAWRENDYLIGRLDGAERMITVLLGDEHPERARWCGHAFLAILEEEEPVLKTVTPLIGKLRGRAQELAGQSTAGMSAGRRGSRTP